MNTRPFVVEFTGTPEAGKTTCIKGIFPTLSEKLNCKVSYIRESAEIVPTIIPKGGLDANLWMFSNTLSNFLESIYDSSFDIILIDRGFVDKAFFGYKFFVEGLCNYEYFSSFLKFSSQPMFVPDLCIHFNALPQESIRRRGGEGRLVTFDWINNYNRTFDEFASNYLVNFKNMSFFTLDTTYLSVPEVSEQAISAIAKAYNKHKNTSV